MSVRHALASLDALIQPTRLAIFRVLIASEPDGLPASAIAEKIGYTAVSSHLSALAQAGLVRTSRRERPIIYRADVGAIKGLVGFLVNDCCGGHPELCDL
jgi:ArsR family transcriptional regulator